MINNITVSDPVSDAGRIFRWSGHSCVFIFCWSIRIMDWKIILVITISNMTITDTWLVISVNMVNKNSIIVTTGNFNLQKILSHLL